MSEGRMCERHGRWNADGVCPYCEPEEVTTLVATMQPPAPDRPVKLEMPPSLLEAAKEAQKRLPPLLPLIEELTQRNKLLQEKPTMCTPHAGDHTFECYDHKRYAHCKCGEFMFDRLCIPAGYPMEGYGGGKFHTPEICRSLTRAPKARIALAPGFVQCKCGDFSLDMRLGQPWEHIGPTHVHTPTECIPTIHQRCKCGAKKFRVFPPAGPLEVWETNKAFHSPLECRGTLTALQRPPLTLGDLANVWADFEKEWKAHGLLKDLPYVEPPRKLTATEVMQQRAVQQKALQAEVDQEVARIDGEEWMSLTPEEQRLVKAYRETVRSGWGSLYWKIPR